MLDRILNVVQGSRRGNAKGSEVFDGYGFRVEWDGTDRMTIIVHP